MSIQRPPCFFNLYSSCSSRSHKRRRDCLLPPHRGRLCCRAGLTAPPYSHHWPSHRPPRALVRLPRRLPLALSMWSTNNRNRQKYVERLTVRAHHVSVWKNKMLPPLVAGCAATQASPPHRTPIVSLAIPLLTHTCCYSPAMADEPVNPRTPLCVGNNFRVFPGSVSFPS